MQNNFSFVEIKEENINLLKQFLAEAGNSLNTFRYYNKRDLNVIKNHLCTYILLEHEMPVGYGHLDKDTEMVWLGIAIAETAKGKGYGNKMLQQLINQASILQVNKIDLSVDANNLSAIGLYKKYGFELQQEKNNILYFSKKIF